MDSSDFFAAKRVAIVGLGLMGGSLAMALKGKCKELIGIDPDPAAVQLALQWKIVDRVSTDPALLIPNADLIVLAAPVGAILRILSDLPALHPGSPVVLDLGSTKVEIVRAMQALPDRFDPIGGHPMCGKEKSSLEFADPSIYIRAPFVLVPLERTSLRAKYLAEELVRIVGSVPIHIQADQHDFLVAYTSHLPYLLASALAGSADEDASALVGPGFRSTTRLAGSSTRMMLDILLTNREAVLSAVQKFRLQMDRLQDLLEQQDYPHLAEQLEMNAVSYRKLTENSAQGGIS
ncbi:MAG: prephenate dehydrogenase/arogenate dehydrogenase family protein [Anaerolineaceae bacterium]|nr:prephenate dehydrogenase/arogenate dehydrogenase family protein [Anaerolineaceae bacterium]